MPMSLHDYYDRIVWVNLAIYILYFIIKYLPAVVYFFIWLVQCCRRSNNSSSDSTGPPLPWFLLLVFGKQQGTHLSSYMPCQHDGAVRTYAHDDDYLTRSKFNSLLTEMITPQTYTYIYTHIKPLPIPCVFEARSELLYSTHLAK